MTFDIQLKISLRNHLLCGQLDELFQQINPLVEMLSEENLCFDPKLDLKDEIIMTLKLDFTFEPIRIQSSKEIHS